MESKKSWLKHPFLNHPLIVAVAGGLIGALITGEFGNHTTKLQVDEMKRGIERTLQQQQKETEPYLFAQLKTEGPATPANQILRAPTQRFIVRIQNSGDPATHIKIRYLAADDNYKDVNREPEDSIANNLMKGGERFWNFTFGTNYTITHLRIVLDYDSVITGAHYTTAQYFNVKREGDAYVISDASDEVALNLENAANRFKFMADYLIVPIASCNTLDEVASVPKPRR